MQYQSPYNPEEASAELRAAEAVCKWARAVKADVKGWLNETVFWSWKKVILVHGGLALAALWITWLVMTYWR